MVYSNPDEELKGPFINYGQLGGGGGVCGGGGGGATKMKKNTGPKHFCTHSSR